MPKRPRDANQLAKMIVDISTGECEETIKTESSKAIAGRKGGIRGGVSRANKLSPSRRSEIAKKAAESRWKKPTL